MHFVKGVANSILTYVPNMIHICPNNTESEFSGSSYSGNWSLLSDNDLWSFPYLEDIEDFLV